MIACSDTEIALLLPILTKVQKFYPIALADKSWDNTGLLVDSSNVESSLETINILLTIDLTQAVTEEAIAKKSNVIMAYHPFIFRGLKSITQVDPQQKSLIKLIKNGISVYSPHTAVDSAKGGVNDFLADGIASGFVELSREPIKKDKVAEGCGAGRIITLQEEVSLNDLIANVKKSLGLKFVQVARGEKKIKTIAICAGSGGEVFKGVDADVFYTGELSHHEALYFKETGSSVIVCNHSNTERAFLRVFREQLLGELLGAVVNISEVDRDPFETI